MNVYFGLFLIAFSGLSLEITLVRLLSVTTWYHLAFFAISTAMLGMTAGATRVHLQPEGFEGDRLAATVSKACLHLALSIPVTLVFLCLVPLDIYRSVMSPVTLLFTTVVCAVPFFFIGTIASAVQTKCQLPVGKLYASDLLGASLGCLFVLAGLELFDAPSLILLCSCTSAAAAACFAWKEPVTWHRRAGALLGLFFLLVGLVNSLTTAGIRPVIVKGRNFQPATSYLLERWNSFSRVAVYNQTNAPPMYWGPGSQAPRESIAQYQMDIDGAAGTVMGVFHSNKDIDYLRYDVTNLAYYLDRRGRTCIIGVGGGRDVQSAILFGQEHVVGVELNPIFVDLLQNRFKDFAGLAGRPDVTLVTAEARSYLAHTDERYSVIQMSMSDTWAATGAGAFSLSENALYTVEAWTLFLDRLDDNGLFTVSRWHSADHSGETGRAVSMAVAVLLRRGVPEPSQHIALIAGKYISTLIVSKQPFTQADVDKLSRVSGELGFSVILLPGHAPAERVLGDIVSARTQSELSAATADPEVNYLPATDESPYFFNMLRLGSIGYAFSSLDLGVVRGNLIATATLIGLLAMLIVTTLAAIVLPLALQARLRIGSTSTARTVWAGAGYFALIGAGYMLTEIALIQRLTLLLSHPLYALGVLLFTLIASTGIGSLVSDRLPLNRAPWAYVYPILTAGCIVSLRFLLEPIIATMITAPILPKIVASVAVIFPMGLLMGVFFPTGLRLAKSVAFGETPWFWAVNGIFGVLCSVLAVFISIYIGVSVNFYIAAICYGAVLIAQIGLQRARASAGLTEQIDPLPFVVPVAEKDT